MSIAKGVGKGVAKSITKKRGRPKKVESIFASGFKDFGKTKSRNLESVRVTKAEVDSIIKKMPEYKEQLAAVKRKLSNVKLGNKEELAAVKRKLRTIKTAARNKKTEIKIPTVSDLKKMGSTELSNLKKKTLSTLNSKNKLKEFADKKNINLTTAKDRLKVGLANIKKATDSDKKTTTAATRTPKKATTTTTTTRRSSDGREPFLDPSRGGRITTAMKEKQRKLFDKYNKLLSKAKNEKEFMEIVEKMRGEPLFSGEKGKVRKIIAANKQRTYIGNLRGGGKGTGKVALIGVAGGIGAGSMLKNKRKRS